MTDKDKKKGGSKKEIMQSIGDMKGKKSPDRLGVYEDEEAQPKYKKKKARGVDEIEIELVESTEQLRGKRRDKKKKPKREEASDSD